MVVIRWTIKKRDWCRLLHFLCQRCIRMKIRWLGWIETTLHSFPSPRQWPAVGNAALSRPIADTLDRNTIFHSDCLHAYKHHSNIFTNPLAAGNTTTIRVEETHPSMRSSLGGRHGELVWMLVWKVVGKDGMAIRTKLEVVFQRAVPRHELRRVANRSLGIYAQIRLLVEIVHWQ